MKLAEVFEDVLGSPPGVRFSVYDGSEAGPAEADVHFILRSPRGVAYVLRAPGDLGLGRAYVAGDLDVEGDMHTALDRMTRPRTSPLSWGDRLRIAGAVRRAAFRRAAPPPLEVRLRGRRHSKRRDASAIAYHYDVSNRFYEWVLGPSMAYTCAVYPYDGATLEQAQEEKFDLVCRKLGLRPGMRLLDVGCGWGGMVLHAARHYGVNALGVTLSEQQAEWGTHAISAAGLGGLAEIRHGDYRDVAETGFNAISSIGLTEHIGSRALGSYFTFLRAALAPGGRLLNHAIMRPTTTEAPLDRHGFTNRYVFPDGEILGLGRIVSTMQNSGFEIRHEENLREHYARTLAAWCANLDAHWDEAIAEVGEGRARVWRLYMAGSRLAFERNTLQLHQVLGVNTQGGQADLPLRPDWETTARSAPVLGAIRSVGGNGQRTADRAVIREMRPQPH